MRQGGPPRHTELCRAAEPSWGEGSPQKSPLCWGGQDKALQGAAVPRLLSLSEGRLRSALIAASKCLHGDKIPGTKSGWEGQTKGQQQLEADPREMDLGGRQARC